MNLEDPGQWTHSGPDAQPPPVPEDEDELYQFPTILHRAGNMGMVYRANIKISTHAAPFRTTALRAFITTFARDHGIDADTTADLVLAINEAAIFLLSHAERDNVLKCRCALQANVLRVMLATRMGSQIPLDPCCFELYVVRQLVDRMDLELHSQLSVSTPTAMLILEKVITRNNL
ncbi:hypothetical protein R4P64_29710 [Rhodococcus sp. IEGM 1366]|uniref:hypothetical protein n=1 Tax=Rhodococcus sp. IEGM 1366 TaxID=3082223 RepID=UPI002953763D|nr:hypothetical protein [Rhodococcus sp. IEGM 1366]MDV8070713.1 hypothetical protein [Rhodococcus sp. IEGM 1366]